MKVLTEFNISDFDTVQQTYSKIINIKVSTNAFNYKEKSEIIENKISKIISYKNEKIFYYKTGIEMKITQDTIEMYCDDENDFPEKSELIYRISMGNGLISLLRLNHKFVIHGTVISNKNNLYALIGKSGMGKSTFATYLVKKHNFELISDDKIVFNEKFKILEGSKVVRLWNDSFKNIFKNIPANFVYHSLLGNNKKFINLENCCYKNCFEEKKFKYNFIVLEKSEAKEFPKIEELNKFELFCYIIKNIYDYDTLTKCELNKEILRVKEMIENSAIKGYKLTYKHDYGQLDDIYKLINEVGDD